MPTYRELLARVKGEIDEIDPRDAAEALTSAVPPTLIDVREADEFEAGAIKGAVHIPRGNLESRIEAAVPDRGTPVIISCQSGARSAFAAKALQDLGYEHVTSLAGGFSRWKQNGHPWAVPAVLDAERRRRYSRHILIPEVGEAGQLKLLSSKVLMIGAGGLGSPAGLYLAAAGVGTLGIIDEDIVDDSNLQRQILHTTDRVGMAKTESARQALTALNPDVEVVAYNERLTSREHRPDPAAATTWSSTARTTSPPGTCSTTRASSTTSRSSTRSIFRFEGQMTVFKPHQAPATAASSPSRHPSTWPRAAPRAASSACCPASWARSRPSEALKLLLDIGEPLVGRLLLVDALEASFHEVALRRDPNCPVCGDNAGEITYIDYEQFCAGRNHVAAR